MPAATIQTARAGGATRVRITPKAPSGVPKMAAAPMLFTAAVTSPYQPSHDQEARLWSRPLTRCGTTPEAPLGARQDSRQRGEEGQEQEGGNKDEQDVGDPGRATNLPPPLQRSKGHDVSPPSVSGTDPATSGILDLGYRSRSGPNAP